jgi:large subunit ribosomal protein L21
MYAVVQIGSQQFRVSEGDKIETTRLATEEGKSVTFDKVLLVDDGKNIKVGQPFLASAKVTATVLKHELGEKVFAFKFRRRKNSQKLHGYRKKHTELSITKISA